MFKFIHAADIHLDSPLKGLERYEGAPVEEMRGATRRAFDNLISLAIAEKVAFVLLAGDLYDGDWKDYNTGLFFVSRMGRLNAAGIRAYLVAGNHDAANAITRSLVNPENVHVFSADRPETKLLDNPAVAIHGQSYAERAVTDNISADYPRPVPNRFNIGMLHTCLEGRPGHEPYAPCRVNGLAAKGYGYWALGHVHQREIVSRDPWIVFPGNIQGRHIRETGAKGCVLVSVDGDRADAEFRDLDVLRWVRYPVDIGGCEKVSEVMDRVRHGLQAETPAGTDRAYAVRLHLHGVCPVHAQLHADREYLTHQCRALAAGLGGERLWVERVTLDTRRTHPFRDAAARDDALGGLLQALRDLPADRDTLAEYCTEFEDLKAGLPYPMRGADRDEEWAFDPTDPDTLSQALEDVRELLLSRLLQERETP